MEPEDPIRWHPKLTPYRFLVLSTTIGLGSAKIYAVSQNKILAATFIEWVIAVVVFSILFILGWFEPQPDDSPRILNCLLTRDLVRVFIQMFSQTPSRYRSDERTEPDDGLERPHRFPPVTGYRFLTSVSVTLFGIAKAYFSYKNNSPAASAFDWSVGTIITCFLYILGLYEKNPVNFMPHLFSDDNPVVASSTLWIPVLIFRIATSLLAFSHLWSTASSYVLDNFRDFGDFGNFLLMLSTWLFLPFALFFLSISRSVDHSPLVSGIRLYGAKFLVSTFSAGMVCVLINILMLLYEWPGVEGAWRIPSYVIKVIAILASIANILFFGFGGLFCLFLISTVSDVVDRCNRSPFIS